MHAFSNDMVAGFFLKDLFKNLLTRAAGVGARRAKGIGAELDKSALQTLASGIQLAAFPSGAGTGAGGVGMFIQVDALARALQKIPFFGNQMSEFVKMTAAFNALHRTFLRIDAKTGRIESVLTHTLEIFQTAMHIFFYPIATALGALLFPLARFLLFLSMIFYKAVMPYLMQFMQVMLASSTEENLQKIVDFLTGKGLIEQLAQVFSSIPNIATANIFGANLEESPFKVFLDLPNVLYSLIINAFTEGLDRLKAVGTALYNIIIDSLSQGFRFLQELGSTLYSFIINSIKGGLDFLYNVGSTLYSFFVEGVKKGLEILTMVGSTLYNLIISTISSTLSILQQVGTSVYSLIVSIISNGISILQTIGSNIHSLIITQVNRGIEILLTVGTILYNMIIAAASGNFNKLQELGITLFNYIIEQIRAGLDSLKNIGQFVYDALTNVISKALSSISFPSFSIPFFGGGSSGGGGGGSSSTSSKSGGGGSSSTSSKSGGSSGGGGKGGGAKPSGGFSGGPLGGGLSGPFRTVFAMQHGGLITEPVAGLGLVSGRAYLLGEAGPERVIPLNKSAGTSTIVVNVNIAGSVYGINDLKRIIDDAVAEATKRRLAL